eukprot:9504081-Pyramimonas_sp.AAC.2
MLCMGTPSVPLRHHLLPAVFAPSNNPIHHGVPRHINGRSHHQIRRGILRGHQQLQHRRAVSTHARHPRLVRHHGEVRRVPLHVPEPDLRNRVPRSLVQPLHVLIVGHPPAVASPGVIELHVGDAQENLRSVLRLHVVPLHERQARLERLDKVRAPAPRDSRHLLRPCAERRPFQRHQARLGVEREHVPAHGPFAGVRNEEAQADGVQHRHAVVALHGPGDVRNGQDAARLQRPGRSHLLHLDVYT